MENERQYEALIGHTLDGVPVYDYNRLLLELEEEYGCDAYEAADWIAHATTGVSGAPVFIQLLEDEET